MRCFCPPREARAALGDHRVEALGQRRDKIAELRRLYGELEALIIDRVAEGDVLAQRQVEQHAVLEDEPDLMVEALLVVLLDGAAVVLDDARGGHREAGQQVQQLRLARGRGPIMALRVPAATLKDAWLSTDFSP